jgi:hypothetical protein
MMKASMGLTFCHIARSTIGDVEMRERKTFKAPRAMKCGSVAHRTRITEEQDAELNNMTEELRACLNQLGEIF